MDLNSAINNVSNTLNDINKSIKNKDQNSKNDTNRWSIKSYNLSSNDLEFDLNKMNAKDLKIIHKDENILVVAIKY